ncbi:hypothetical protein Tco_0940985 [Tanacetum coccineum]|uniref:Uncharacterized protein n=1 Tax=Tanacetum coccineum TaxID=301880 RepID=A0ABQ5DPJ5_9ASTR
MIRSDCLAKLLEEEPVACLITDAVWHFTQLVADSVKLPRIVLSTSSMSCLPVYAALTSLGENVDFKTSIEEEWAPKLALMIKRDIKGGFRNDTSSSSLLELDKRSISCKQQFLWVNRPGSVSGSESLELLPKGFIEEVGERGCIVKWAPQQEVLAQAIGAFWTYNGWNSTLESIC